MKSVIITGASSGIGRATALQLANTTNFELILVSRRLSHLESVAIDCAQYTSQKIHTLALDISQSDAPDSISGLLSSAAPPCALVNSAGFGTFGETACLSVPQLADLLNTNLIGTFAISRTVIQKMIEKKTGGTIVNISSDADKKGFPDASIYCASKGGLSALSRAWQTELITYGIRVCNISPGRVDTHFNNKSPGQRPGALLADEVAEVICFAITCSPNIELSQIDLESVSRQV